MHNYSDLMPVGSLNFYLFRLLTRAARLGIITKEYYIIITPVYMTVLPISVLVFFSITSFFSPVVPPPAAMDTAYASRADSTGTYFYVKKLKGTVNWNSDPEEPRGNITFTAQLPSEMEDLSFLQDVSIPSLIILRSQLGEAEFSPGVFTCNAAKTVARAKTVEGGTTLLCKLKLKKEFLSITLRGKNGYNLPQGFGITNVVSNGWQKQKVTVEFILLYGGHVVVGSSEERIRFLSKSGKKTKVK